MSRQRATIEGVLEKHSPLSKTLLQQSFSSRTREAEMGRLPGLIRDCIVVADFKPDRRGQPTYYSLGIGPEASTASLSPVILDLLSKHKVLGFDAISVKLLLKDHSKRIALRHVLDELIKTGLVRRARGFLNDKVSRVGSYYYLVENELEFQKEHSLSAGWGNLLIQQLSRRGRLNSSEARNQPEKWAAMKRLVEAGKARRVLHNNGIFSYFELVHEAPGSAPEAKPVEAEVEPVLEALTDGPMGFERLFESASHPILTDTVRRLTAEGKLGKDIVVGPDGRQQVVFFRVGPDTPACNRCGDSTIAKKVEGGFDIALTVPGVPTGGLHYDHLCGACRIQFGELAKLTAAHVHATLDTFRAPRA
jgi:hypothetical protein